mmetsp:Transcript_16461/g.34381  ORF Transcript_16461/g.34381 Transcript_16461/m.34381 type:complete len:80 (-) Transcript_16461:192-431(-)
MVQHEFQFDIQFADAALRGTNRRVALKCKNHAADEALCPPRLSGSHCSSGVLSVSAESGTSRSPKCASPTIGRFWYTPT